MEHKSKTEGYTFSQDSRKPTNEIRITEINSSDKIYSHSLSESESEDMTENPLGRRLLEDLEAVRGPTRPGRSPGTTRGRTAATARPVAVATWRAAVHATLASAPSSCSLLRASSRFLRSRLFCVFVRPGWAPGVSTLAAGGRRGRFRTRGG